MISRQLQNRWTSTTAVLGSLLVSLGCSLSANAAEPRKESTLARLPADAPSVPGERAAGAELSTLDTAEKNALAYLIAQQQPDGSVARRYKVAVTSLSGLAMLGAGGTPIKGPRQKEIAAAMNFVRSQQGRDGHLPAIDGSMYEHAFATLFLAECLRVSGQDMEAVAKLEVSVAKAVRLIVDAQHHEGGWRYQPGQPGDVSSTSCQLLALDAARRADIKVPKATLDKAVAFLLTCQHGNGGFTYMPDAGVASVTRTAACANSLFVAGKKDAKELGKAREFLRVHPAPEISSAHYLYYALFMSRVMARDEGKAGATWRAETAKALLATQRDDGSWLGPMGQEYATAMTCLVLQARGPEEE